MMRYQLLAVVGLALVTLSTGSVEAETRAWETAKRRLPGKLFAVVSADGDQLRGSGVIQAVMPEVTARHAHAGVVIDRVKSDCGIDGTQVVTGAVLALGDDERGVLILSLAGVTEAKVATCLKTIGKKDKKVVTARKLRGPLGIVEYATRGSSDKRYVAWLAADVVAIATEPGDKALLEAMITGEGVRGDLGTALSRFNHGAAAWGALASDKLFEPEAKARAAYATLAIAGDSANVQASIVFHVNTDAARMAAEMKKQLGRPISANLVPPELVRLMKAIAVKHVGDTVSLRVSLPANDVMALARLAQQLH